MGSSKKVTTGYRYKMGLHIGVCQGPVDEFSELRAGDRTAWSGSVTDNTTVEVRAPDLFGGDDREGGILGKLDVLMGKPDQAVNSYLSAKIGTLTAFRGFVSVVFRGGLARTSKLGMDGIVQATSELEGGLICSNNPYVKPWAFRVKRILKGWDGDTVWNSAKATINVGTIAAMNPAHIVYQCLTDRRWGRGFSPGRLDLPSFEYSANTFFDEGFGLCMLWTKQAEVEDFIQQVINHAGAAVGEDPRTGLIRMRPIRDDYDIEDLKVFSPAEGNIVELVGFDRASPIGCTNEITVKYLDQVTGKVGSVSLQHLASIQSQNRVNAATKDYPGLPNGLLASRIAARDLTAATSGVARVRIKVDRDGFGLLPGDVIAFTWPDLGVELMPVRIARVDYGNYTNGEITLEGVQDVFGLPLTTYITPEDPGWVEPPHAPQPSAAVMLFEVPYRDLVSSMGPSDAELLDPGFGMMGCVATRPPGVPINYALETRVSPADYELAATGDFTPSGTLSAPLSKIGTSITLLNAIDLDSVEVGQGAMIEDVEIVRVDSFDRTTGVIGIARGCSDTVPRAHAGGARIWFYDAAMANDPKEYALGEIVSGRVRTQSTTGPLDAGLSPGANVTMAQRAYLPFPPGDLRFNFTRYQATIAGPLTVSWAHRDRLLQEDQLIDTLQGNVGPEAGVTYTVKLYDQTGTLRRTVAEITGTEYVWASEGVDSGIRGDTAVLYMNGSNGSTIITDECLNIWTCAGNAQLSTAQKKYGTASLALDGAGDYISTPDYAGHDFGNGKFTVGAFVRFTAAPTNVAIVSKWSATAADQSWALEIVSGVLRFRFRDTGGTMRITGAAWAPTLNTWYYVAAIRDAGGLVRVYIDGTQIDANAFSQDITNGTTGVRIGSLEGTPGTFDVNGFVDSVLISQEARYAGTSFTVPAAEVPALPGLNNPVRATVESVRGGLVSKRFLDHTAAR